MNISNNYSVATLSVQLIHVALCIVWNLVGVYQLSQGIQSIGPTASLIGVVILFVFGSALFLAASKNWRWLYLSVSLLLVWGAVSAIYGGFTKDVALWPTPFWRYAGILVNAVGVVGFCMVIASLRRLTAAVTVKEA